MIRILLAMILALPSLAAGAEQAGHAHTPGMSHDASEAASAVRLTEPGQGAFAAIQEVVAMLVADPDTDWSTVDIDRLRRHLVDMNNVTLHAEATAEPVPGGLRFVVTGEGQVIDSIRRMLRAHAATMSGTDGMTIRTEDLGGGAIMTVTLDDPDDLPKLEALGVFGVLALGMHHQAHHLMIATGRAPHD